MSSRSESPSSFDSGSDVTIVSYSRMAVASMVAAEWLAKDGIEAEVIDLRTLRPLDMEPVLESVRKTNQVVVAEEGWRSCGMGAEIASRIYEGAFDYLDSPVARVAAPEVPVAYNATLERDAIPDEHNVLEAVRRLVRSSWRGTDACPPTIVMPKMGYDMNEGKIVNWLKKVGDQVQKGEPIAEIETEKVNIQIEAFASGVLQKILVQEGETVPVGQPIAEIGTEGEVPAQAAKRTWRLHRPTSRTAEPKEQPTSHRNTRRSHPGLCPPSKLGREREPRHHRATPRSPVQGWPPNLQGPRATRQREGETERVKASPVARRLAEEQGVELNQVEGTGPGGRITKEDVERFLTEAAGRRRPPGRLRGKQPPSSNRLPGKQSRRDVPRPRSPKPRPRPGHPECPPRRGTCPGWDRP